MKKKPTVTELNEPQRLALEVFKRLPNAAVVHVVLSNVWVDDMAGAMRYKKAMGAKQVTTVLRNELATLLKEEADVTDKAKQ